MIPEPVYILVIWSLGAMWHYQREMRKLENHPDVRSGNAGIEPFPVLIEATAWWIVWPFKLLWVLILRPTLRAVGIEFQ